MAAPEMSARAQRLASPEREHHPHAVDASKCTLHAHSSADGPRCAIKRPHPAHPYGAIHPSGDGLSHWCLGRTV